MSAGESTQPTLPSHSPALATAVLSALVGAALMHLARAPFSVVGLIVAAFVIALPGPRRGFYPWAAAIGALACVAVEISSPASVPPWARAGADGGYGATIGGGLLLLFAAFLACMSTCLSWRVGRTPTGHGVATGVLTVVTAACLSAQMIGLARLGLRITPGEVGDELVFWAVGLSICGAAAVSFTGVTRRLSAAAQAFLGWAASGAMVLALAVVAAVVSPTGFARLCARIGADASFVGTPAVDALAAATMFVLPLLVIGAALSCTTTRAAFGMWIAGAAFGGPLAQWLFESEFPVFRSSGLHQGSAAVVLIGFGVTSAALVLGALFTKRPIAALAGAVGIGAALWTPLTAILVEPPWRRFRTPPERMFETWDGQFTFERTSAGLRVLLDQKTIAPAEGNIRLERRALEQTLADRRRLGIAVDHLHVVGLVTRARARLLAEQGVRSVSCSVSFGASIPRVESELRDAESAGATDPPVRVTYDQETSGAVHFSWPVGADVALGMFDCGSDEARHLWWRAERPPFLARDLDNLAVTDALRSFAFAGPPHPRQSSISPLDWMRTRLDERPRRALRVASQLGRETDPGSHVANALWLHAQAQRPSSPFESADEQIEVDVDALVHLAEAFQSGAGANSTASHRLPGALARDMAEGFARVLHAQREVPMTLDHITPIARAAAHWPALERAIAQAEAEQLQFERAIERLERCVREDPGDSISAAALARMRERAAAWVKHR